MVKPTHNLKKRIKVYSDSVYKTDGGGTTYLNSFLNYYKANGYQVHIAQPNKLDDYGKYKALVVYGLRTILRLIIDLVYFDIILFKTNYIPSFTLNRKNLLIVDFPLQKHISTADKRKLSRISQVICNSKYTSQWIKNYWDVNSIVIYPPAISKPVTTLSKNNVILSVGRFVDSFRSKKQDILIDAFKLFYDRGNKDFTLKLAGFVQNENYLKELIAKAQGYPVEFIINADDNEIIDLYAESKFYWHACGYGININTHPELVEHYGIAIADAITMECIPLVYANGGPEELVKLHHAGETWQSIEDLINKTEAILHSQEKKNTLIDGMKLAAPSFTEDSFNKLLSKI